jgi:hypothetical protein
VASGGWKPRKYQENLWRALEGGCKRAIAIWNRRGIVISRAITRIDEVFPSALRATTNEQEMFLRLKNGSTFSVIGSDQFDALVGAPPLGIVFSEWARAVPDAFGYLAPILVENNGFAVFLTTPLGANHCKAMYEMACKDPTWFAELQTVADTGSISLEAVEQQRKEYVALYGDAAGNASRTMAGCGSGERDVLDLRRFACLAASRASFLIMR